MEIIIVTVIFVTLALPVLWDLNPFRDEDGEDDKYRREDYDETLF